MVHTDRYRVRHTRRLAIWLSASVAVLPFILSACGGDGLNVTPAPVPSPSPSPTPSPTPSPSPSPTPSPSPSPTPSPTPTPLALSLKARAVAITSTSPLTANAIATTITGSSTDRADGSTDTSLTFTTANGVITSTFNNKNYVDDTKAGQAVKAISVPVSTTTDPNIPGATGIVEIENFRAVANLQYTSFGTWDIATSSSAPVAYYVGVFSGGDTSQVTATMPTTGTATYSGGATGFALANGNGYRFYGTSSLNADFATDALTGSITNIAVYPTGSGASNTALGTMNAISLAGSISGNVFSGTSAAAATAGTAVNIAGATGTLNGGFFGPNAAEASGVFDLSGAGTQVMGSFGAAKVPSDRRLKTDIRPAGIAPSGLHLYSWRYCGGAVRYVGVIAQDLLADRRFAAVVTPGGDGFLRVDYARLGYVPANFWLMDWEGEAAAARHCRRVN